MTDQQTCPKCQSTIPSNAPAGICPSCLMNVGLDPESLAELVSTSAHTGGFVPPTPAEISRQFPDLEIDQLIGRGGMGAVYKAKQPDLDRNVAIKILPIEVGSAPTFTERFFREARALAKLSHQNIVTVFDFGQIENQYYFVMEYVDGTDLRQVIDAGNIDAESALEIVRQICDALQFAHSQGVVHRDIKPENILIDKQGNVKIADFGLAKLVDNDTPETSLTGTRQVMGTLRYMAPEQSKGTKLVDHRADIFSLGVIFYELLTGDLPIGRFQPPSKKASTDSRLDDIVLRALENEPSDRYQNASEVNQDIASINSHPAFVAAQPPIKADVRYEYPENSGVSKKAIWGFALFFLFLVAAFLAIFVLLTPYSSVEYSDGTKVSQTQATPVFYVLAFVSMLIVPVGLSSPVTTPLLGYLALQEIQNSNGKVKGLFFAVFDLLIFPVLILNILICIACISVSSESPINTNSFMFRLSLGLLISLVCDVFIFRWAMKNFVKDDSEQSVSNPIVSPKHSTQPVRQWTLNIDRDRFFWLLVCVNIAVVLLAYVLAPRVQGVFSFHYSNVFDYMFQSVMSPVYRNVRIIAIATVILSIGVFYAFAPKNEPEIK